MNTRGIHLIWTCYMTWPPGDERGHWSPLFDFYGRLVDRGHKLQMPDNVTRRKAMALAKEPPMVLSDAARAVVADAIALQVKSGLRIHAAAVEPTHVHLLIAPTNDDLHAVVGRLKGTSSSAALAMPEYEGRTRTWTAGYWKVFLFDDEGVYAVKQYIEAHNERAGRPASPYDWIDPI